MYLYYKYSSSSEISIISINEATEDGNFTGYNHINYLPKGLKISKAQPQLNNFTNISWYALSLFTKAGFHEYQILDDAGRIVSYARTIGKIYKFPFMGHQSIHIGPCMTVPEYRGRGFYPLLLIYIQHCFGNDRYMIVHETNHSSIRGIEKAGFKAFAKGHSTRFKRYVIDAFI